MAILGRGSMRDKKKVICYCFLNDLEALFLVSLFSRLTHKSPANDCYTQETWLYCCFWKIPVIPCLKWYKEIYWDLNLFFQLWAMHSAHRYCIPKHKIRRFCREIKDLYTELYYSSKKFTIIFSFCNSFKSGNDWKGKRKLKSWKQTRFSVAKNHCSWQSTKSML